jgi:hypothetical protein
MMRVKERCRGMQERREWREMEEERRETARSKSEQNTRRRFPPLP